MSHAPGTEHQLREALAALAEGVTPAPDAYRTARGDWHRRERRRRLVLAVLIGVVFALATLIGLWVLNQAPSADHTIFDAAAAVAVPATVPPEHGGRPGPGQGQGQGPGPGQGPGSPGTGTLASPRTGFPGGWRCLATA